MVQTLTGSGTIVISIGKFFNLAKKVDLPAPILPSIKKFCPISYSIFLLIQMYKNLNFFCGK